MFSFIQSNISLNFSITQTKFWIKLRSYSHVAVEIHNRTQKTLTNEKRLTPNKWVFSVWWCEFGTKALLIFYFHLSFLYYSSGQGSEMGYMFSKERYSIGKKLLCLFWEKTVLWPLFLLANTLHIFLHCNLWW